MVMAAAAAATRALMALPRAIVWENQPQTNLDPKIAWISLVAVGGRPGTSANIRWVSLGVRLCT